MTSEFVPADELRPGDVVSIGTGSSWRKVTEIHAPTHPLADAVGALVIEGCLWMDGRTLPPRTVFPDVLVERVRTAEQDEENR